MLDLQEEMAWRPRRLRKTQGIRNLVQENHIRTEDLIQPLFVVSGQGIKEEISSMPGQFRFSLDTLEKEVAELVALGIGSVILFGIPEKKDATGSSACSDDGIIQRAIRRLRKSFPVLYVITDLCFCEYTDHGHCGVIKEQDVDNDPTLSLLAEQAVSHARAGAHMVAPSGMMDGMVQAIRRGLDEYGYTDTAIMSYAVKYASAFYGPFRDAVESAPGFGDRRTYQMNPANSREAVWEALLDEGEGADVLMVKPALSYLDVVRRVRETSHLPLAVYNVSGEYSMIKNAAQAGLINEEQMVQEVLLSMKRAGADIIISYFAKEVAQRLRY